MNRLILGTALALATSVGLAAQQSTTKTQTKVDVKDGKNVTVTGCVDRAASGQGFVLTRVESGGTPSPFYALVGEDGRARESRGSSRRDPRQGHRRRRRRQGGRDHEDEGRARARRRHAHEGEDEIEGTTDVPFLGVKSVKMLRDTARRLRSLRPSRRRSTVSARRSRAAFRRVTESPR